jgi:excisionase family DNA binding protein
MNKIDDPVRKFESLLTPREVSQMFRVDSKTVVRWARAGKLSSIRTLGGHRRYREAEVRELLRTHADDKV